MNSMNWKDNVIEVDTNGNYEYIECISPEGNVLWRIEHEREM